ncbi:hypothetical protein J1N35_028023 [Gossypium stocksii]|uniref:Uncharacterized protein n=1 Tax=Gossypium stocksii TaxID=47602 RepID=A0A9D3ZQQ0_9ROSI|nr:hypothetical protein J1N35_028023 [Gossypium stocksii]
MLGVLNTIVDNTTMGELAEKNDALETIVMTLKEQITELKGELAICKVVLDRMMRALIDMGASDLFILKRVVSKLGLSVSKLTKKLKTVNSKEVPTMEVTQGVELQTSQWKGKEDFEVIHLDDYDFVLVLNFLDKINALLVPFAACICILDTHKRQCAVSVSCDEKGGTKIVSTIYQAKDVHCGKNIKLADRSAKEIDNFKILQYFSD